jgi:hypothetical protein
MWGINGRLDPLPSAELDADAAGTLALTDPSTVNLQQF